MYTTGTGAEIAAIFFLIFMLIVAGCLYNNRAFLITTFIFPGTGYARQRQQVKAKYEHDRFHRAKIMVLEKTY